MRLVRPFVILAAALLASPSWGAGLAEDVSSSVSADGVERTVREFSGLGSRVLGYPGNAKAADAVIARLEALGFARFDPHAPGVGAIPDRSLMVDAFETPVPVDRGAALEIAGKLDAPITVYPLWPNLVRTPQLPRAGVTGPLVWVGQGTYREMDGKRIDGSIALMDFNCGKNYVNARDLGAQAILFIEPEETSCAEAASKMLEIPVDIPRFWISRADADRIRRLGAADAKLTCRMPWENAEGRNVYALIYGTDPELRKDVIVVQSYYDSMSVVPSLAPGADTTGGIAGLLALAEYFKAHPPKRSVMLVATGAHFVQWEGVVDWALRHAPRGGTELNESASPATAEGAFWTSSLWLCFAALSAALVAAVVFTSRAITRLKRAAPDDAAAERRMEGLSSLRFVASLLLVPAALIVGLAMLEHPFSFRTEEPLVFAHGERMKFFFSLDLSSSSNKVGLFYDDSAHYDKQWDGGRAETYMNQYAARLVEIAGKEKVAETLGARVQNCVSPWGRHSGDFVPFGATALDGTIFLRTGNPCLTLLSIEDLRERQDTPLDTADRVNYANLAAEVRASVALIAGAADAPGFLRQDTSQALRDRAKRVTTRVVEGNFRESFVADTPVVAAVVVYKQAWNNFIPSSGMNYHGVRGLRVAMTDRRGVAVDRFLQAGGSTETTSQMVEVRPYRLSDDDGRVVYAPDRGEQGAKSYAIDVWVSHPDSRHQVVAFPCEPLDLYQLTNPRYLRAVGSGGQDPPTIFNADDAEPEEFGWDLILDQDMRVAKTENVAVVYVKRAPPGTLPGRVKFIAGSMVFGVEYLATNTSEPDASGRLRPQGVGWPAVPLHRVPNSALSFGRDVIRLDDWRMAAYEKYGVVRPWEARLGAQNDRLATIHHLAKENLAEAEKALSELRYHDFRQKLDEALGFEARAYPDVKGSANDIVKGFLFYCILLLPFAYFCERLFLGFGDIRKQLFGFSAFFLLIFGLMALVHPVFRITEAPYVILLSFVVLVLAVSVLAIIIAKFNDQMAKMRRRASNVHEADVGRLSATGTAIVLGISNMKKRKVRTMLTTATLVLLTFTVMSFTSVKTETVYNVIPQSHKAAYTGLLMRDRGWFALESQSLDEFRRHYEPMGDVLPRAWLSAYDPGAESNMNFIIASGAGRQVNCEGLAGMAPGETKALGLDALLVAGRWFRAPDEPSVILPSRVAFDLLGLTKGDVDAGRATVRLRGLELTVAGVLDSARLDQSRDLDDEPWTPLDMATKTSFGERIKEGTFSENLVEIVKLPHLAFNTVAIVPYDVCMQLGGRIASAAVVFPEGTDFEPPLKSFLERVGMTVFMGRDGRVTAYSSIALSSVGSVGNLFVPILIAALIVLNTMMGSVHERAREIGIYSSVGLAPTHIGFLFLAESCVYAVMGAVAGYLLGAFVGKAVSVLDIPGLTLNYSSLSAVFSTLVVMATVVLSTLYPAKMAANMAVPDVTRQWKFPEPTGDVWKFDFPFTVASKGVVGLFVFLDNYFASYREESIGSFYADHIRFYPVKAEHGSGCVVELDCWLAPFDLSVSQNVQLRALPTEDEGITRIEVCITRLSGEVSNWQRLNRGFLTLLRKQFLIWRTVPSEVKEQYQLDGRERLRLEA